LDFDIQTTGTSIQTHDWMLRELTRNLLHNAIRYSPPGGRLHLRLTQDHHWATLLISDSGPGISDELRKRLFQPFSAGQSGSGSGLGLAICLEITRTLGGHIELINRERRGQRDGLDTIARLPLAASTVTPQQVN